MRVLGLDPGLRNTGWGIIDMEGSHLRHVADGVVHSDSKLSLAERLVQLHQGVLAVIARWAPEEAAVEQTFVNKNPESTLKLGQARGAVLLAPALSGLHVGEYSPASVKQAVVGTGRAAKDQVGMMVRTLLPGCPVESPDAADALAVAICHAHHRATAGRLAMAVQMAGGTTLARLRERVPSASEAGEGARVGALSDAAATLTLPLLRNGPRPLPPRGRGKGRTR